jgi:hypothetical protein
VEQIVEWRQEGVALAALPDEQAQLLLPRLANALAWGAIAAAGVCVSTGEFREIPQTSWRLELPWKQGPINQVERAVTGLTVMVDALWGPEVNAVVATSDLAKWLGASAAPEPPSQLPTAMRSRVLKSTPVTPALPDAGATISSEDEMSRPEVSRGGRPQTWDWDAFWAEIVRRAQHPDGLPDDRAELHRAMLDWFMTRYAKEPAESEVRRRIAMIYPLKK